MVPKLQKGLPSPIRKPFLAVGCGGGSHETLAICHMQHDIPQSTQLSSRTAFPNHTLSCFAFTFTIEKPLVKVNILKPPRQFFHLAMAPYSPSRAEHAAQRQTGNGQVSSLVNITQVKTCSDDFWKHCHIPHIQISENKQSMCKVMLFKSIH